MPNAILYILSFVRLKVNSNVLLIISMLLSVPNLSFLMAVTTKSTWKPMIVEILVLLLFRFPGKRQGNFQGVFNSTILDSKFPGVSSQNVHQVMKLSFLLMEKNILVQKRIKKSNLRMDLLFVRMLMISADIGIIVVTMIVVEMGNVWPIESASVDIFIKDLLVLRLLIVL